MACRRPGEPLPAPPLIRDACGAGFLAAAESATINRDRVGQTGSLGPGRGPLPQLGRRRVSARPSVIRPGPLVSCRTLIVRKRPLLEQPENVAAADVHLSQSLKLNDGKLAHDGLGRSA
jgi:hypothetical protein